MAAKSKGRKKRTQNRKKKTEQNALYTEIVIWITLAVSLLMIVSIFGFGGFLGGFISDFLFWLFGIAAYAIPFALFGGTAFLLSNRENRQAYVKFFAGVVFLFLICILLQLIDRKGGILGELFAGILTPAIGVAGTYMLVFICMIICTVIITGKSVLGGMKNQGNKAYEKARLDAARRKEEQQERKKNRIQEQQASMKEKRRRDHYVEGVSFDTTLTGKSPNIRELAVNPMEPGSVVNQEPGDGSQSFVIHRSEDSDDHMNNDDQAEEAVLSTAKVESNTSKRRKNDKDIAKETADVQAVIDADLRKEKQNYNIPPISLLKRGKKHGGESDASLRETAMKLQQTLQNFGVNVTITNVSCGPSVTRYELQPEMGVKVSKIVGLADDIKLNLAAADIRIEAPIPGKAAVGIEVPNKENAPVMLRELLESPEFKNSTSSISFAVGKDIGGKVVVADIAKMPHLLIAGATGSGKSVCINTLIMSIIYKASPEEVKLIMIDPKVVELSVYNGIPHLMIPVVTDPKKAAGALNWGVAEMTRRYQAFAELNVRDMKGYNEKIKSSPPIEGKPAKPMPQIVIIVDELADLMMVAPGDVEEAICRLAQLARAAGIHLVLATQRPSVNVITGLIKANMPSRIAFSVSSGVDSRTIIDMNGAEKLLGKGDMLFYPSGYQKPARVQGSFVTDKEVQNVVDYLKTHNGEIFYDEQIVNQVNTSAAGTSSGISSADNDERDVHFVEAGQLIIDKEKASIGMLQRAFKIGFNRAARIMDQLAEAGVVGPEEGTKPRKVLMSSEEFEKYIHECM